MGKNPGWFREQVGLTEQEASEWPDRAGRGLAPAEPQPHNGRRIADVISRGLEELKRDGRVRDHGD